VQQFDQALVRFEVVNDQVTACPSFGNEAINVIHLKLFEER
jgi:hypothetical protein